MLNFSIHLPPSVIACYSPIGMAVEEARSGAVSIFILFPQALSNYFSISSKKEIEASMRSVSPCNCFSIEYAILPSYDSFDLLTSR